jgi:hypothetical protein
MGSISQLWNIHLSRLKIFLVLSMLWSSIVISQTTFTKSAAAYRLNIAGTKYGGHAWADYDLDGDFDLAINTWLLSLIPCIYVPQKHQILFHYQLV